MQMNPNRDTQLCMSLSGRPGNFGLRFHNHLYEQLGLNFYYKAFSSQDLPGAVGGIRALGIRGCGVSMPFKEACIALVDELDASAAAIQSINTIVNTERPSQGLQHRLHRHCPVAGNPPGTQGHHVRPAWQRRHGQGSGQRLARWRLQKRLDRGA